MAQAPTWKAAENGFPGNLEATNHASQIGQFLGTHDITPIYQGNQILFPGTVSNSDYSYFVWLDSSTQNGDGQLVINDIDQKFTMPAGSTTISRIQVAVKPIGKGADLKVTLYPDNGSGFPNLGSPLASTVAPAAWITNLGAPAGLTTGGVLATAFSNILMDGSYVTESWGAGATSATGTLTSASAAASNQYVVFVGGKDSVSGNPVPYVYTSQLSSTGASALQAQPGLPQPLLDVGVALTSDTLISVGGYTGSATVNSVYTANWDGNTGTVSSWSTQAVYPLAVDYATTATWSSMVYVLGGWTGTAAVSNVYYANVSNGQIQSWTAGPPLPSAVFGAKAAVIGDILLVIGGASATSTPVSTVYWATIKSDGSLSGWRMGPSLPVAVWDISPSTLACDSGVYIMGGDISSGFSTILQSLSLTGDGLGAWQQQEVGGEGGENLITGGYSNGDGTYTKVSFGTSASNFTEATTLSTVPYISAPLPVSGLTAGATYHLMFHQVGGDANNCLQLGQVFDSSQEWLRYSRYSGAYSGVAWTQVMILASIFDQATAGPLLHTWEDPTGNNLATRTTTLVSDYRGRLLGVCEATTLSQDPLNQNNLTTSSTSPWTASGGTLTASTAETQGGYAYSGLLTPSGSASLSYAASELMPVTGGQWYRASGWLYSTPGYSNISLSVNWFDHAGTYLSTSSDTVSLAAATWTQALNVFQAPAGAAQGQLVPTEGGTPPATAVLYMSDVTLTPADPTTLASVAAVDYPTGAVWPPTGVTQLN